MGFQRNTGLSNDDIENSPLVLNPDWEKIKLLMEIANTLESIAVNLDILRISATEATIEVEKA